MRNLLILLLLLSPIAATADTKSEAKSAAEAHYQAASEKNEEAWIDSYVQEKRESYRLALSNKVRGHELGSRWGSVYRKSDAGITYKFQKFAKVKADEVKMFFTRKKPDGSQDGYPIPITMKKEADGWKVLGATY